MFKASESIKDFLIDQDIGTGQILWIDTHAIPGMSVLMSVIYNKNLPYRKSSRHLNFMILDHSEAWFDMYYESNLFLTNKLGTDGNEAICVSGSLLETDRKAFITWYTEYQNDPNAINGIRHTAPGQIKFKRQD